MRQINLSSQAEAQMGNILSYLTENLNNYQAAYSVFQDIRQTLGRLTYLADGLAPCENISSPDIKYYSIQLKKHHYRIIYHFDDKAIYVDNIYHNSQDYENLFQE